MKKIVLTIHKKKLKFDICVDLIKRNNDVGNNVYKAEALDPRYKSLQFLTEETRALIWEELQIEVQNERFEVKQKPSMLIETENEDNIDEPQIKKKKSLLADSDDEYSELDENDVKVQFKKFKEQKDVMSKD